MEDQPIVRLNFTCNRNWEDMTAVNGGRFCNNCQKRVVDFADKTSDEIAAYLVSSTTQVCGRFQQSQLSRSRPKPVWKRWLSAAAMFVTVFIGVKEASAQQQLPAKKSDSAKKSDPFVMGEVLIISNRDAQFPGGEAALFAYINKNIHPPKSVTGRVTTVFTIETDGSLTDIKVIKGLSKEADEEAIRVLKESPKWLPSIQNGRRIKVAYTVPFFFNIKK